MLKLAFTKLIKIIPVAFFAVLLVGLSLVLLPTQPVHAQGPVVNLGDLPPGKVVTLTFRAAITDPIPSGVTQVCNQATISGANFATIVTNDPTTPAPNDPTCTPLDLETDLGLSKSHTGSAVPGTAITYTLVVTNAGPQPVSGATVTDTFPAALSGVTWDCVAGGGANCNGSSGAGNLNQSVNLPVGGRITYTVIATIVPAATGVLTNTASVSLPAGLSDPLPGNNSATDVATLSPQIDLVVVKSESLDPVLAGSGAGNLTYVISVTNQGPSDASNVSVSEVLTLPAGVTVDAITPSAGSFVSPTWTIPSLPVNTSQSLTVTLTVGPATAPGTDGVGDTASVTGAGQTRINPGDDAASASTSVASQADLVISKSVTPASALPGQTLTYTLVFTNNGPSLATGVIITDIVPLTVTNVTSTSSGASLTPIVGPDFRWQVEDLSLAEGGRITLTGQINPALTDGMLLTNTAQIGSAVADGTSGNNSSSAVISVPLADLSVSKNSSRDPNTPLITYTLTVNNAGPSPANGATVADPLPAGVSSFSWSCVPVGGATCNSGSGAGSLNQPVPTFPVGGQVRYTLIATLVSTDTIVTNTATVTAPSGLTDPISGNNTASDTNAPAPAITPLYLPLIFKDLTLAPDLVIDSLTASSSGVTVVIRNQGTAPVGAAFWVDVYFNPSVPPAVNQPWPTIASHGVVWGVTGAGLSQLTPGGTLTLTSGGAYYFPQYSSTPPLPVGANVYGLVDSVNFSTTYGAVPESNEANNRFGPVLSTAAAGSPSAGQAAAPSSEGLPSR